MAKYRLCAYCEYFVSGSEYLPEDEMIEESVCNHPKFKGGASIMDVAKEIYIHNDCFLGCYRK